MCTPFEMRTPHADEGADHHPCRTGQFDDDDDKYIPDGQNLQFLSPLMSNKIEKDELIRFIQEKYQGCMLHLDEIEQQYSYFFWRIMESFRIQNGRATMDKIARILFNGYRFLRRKGLKIRPVAIQQDWCLPLAGLLCSNTPEDDKREAVIEMGNEFASREWIYAAHICYVVAHVWLDSRQKFQLIGCDSEPVGNTALWEAIERTEVYEYMLFLSSGYGQPDFQVCKFLHACKLHQAGHTSQALDYCEIIAKVAVKFPQCIHPNTMECFRQVAIKCINKRKQRKYITIPGETRSLPLEVALMEMVSRPPQCNNIVALLEWFETPTYFILVMERPNNCTDLLQLCKRFQSPLSESMAQLIMLQVVRAARHCCDRGVLHRDIKTGNLLFCPDTFEVKLIDFGCGDLLTDKPYTSYAGTPNYFPPEWISSCKYFGIPATVWGLGILLYFLVVGQMPFVDFNEIVTAQVPFISSLSDECNNLIAWCLNKDPEMRPSFDEILSHNWLGDRIEDPSAPADPT
ncbi:serine/threonine-protein kinase PLK4-like isoform X4 [Tachysurus fulvidraco]|uniref:serine/threonine-protein kinase PLK4-like isoform X4 n=1 Tax=Tachysurus fulvidraco TaxID=1234273 RepID=UPI001FEE2FF2|nr:serine/threonine-protein kinase PLK4-like isoform X4 [Tachysurus fulvidraco]